MKRNSRGFTLVEILIVVIILGILAAIVIPQFTNASSEARSNSVASTLQTLRGQIELFKIQHGDLAPGDVGGLSVVLMGRTNPADTTTTNATGTLGPYVQAFPVNPVNGWSTVAAAGAANVGWVYAVNGGQYTIQATDTTGTGLLTY
jgi:general secretion pathway protein G